MEKNEKEILMIPFVAHESAMNRMERNCEKLMTVIKILVLVIVLMIIGITIYLYLPTEVEETSSGNQDIVDVDNSSINQNVGDK